MLLFWLISFYLSSWQYLQSFIRFAPGDYSSYCAERLRRTEMNGVRGEPPAWLELQVLALTSDAAANISN